MRAISRIPAAAAAAVLVWTASADIAPLSPFPTEQDIATVIRQYSDAVRIGSFAEDGTPIPATIDAAALASAIDTLAPDGSWPDLQYDSEHRSHWPGSIHASRILLLARAAARDGADSPAAAAFHRSLAFWLDKRPTSKNWWNNRIGAPRDIGTACLLLDGTTLSEDERQRVVDYLKVCGNPSSATGQNRIWHAEGRLLRALLARDARGVQASRDVISTEIAFAAPGKEGLQDDGCYHQHGPQNQLGNYGWHFIQEQTLLNAAFAGTACAYGDPLTDVLAFLLEEGYGWVLWRGYIETGSLGRQLVRDVARDKAAVVDTAAGFLALDGTAKHAALRARIHSVAVPGNAPAMHTGDGDGGAYKYFHRSAFSVYRTPSWMAAVHMNTPKIRGTELINEDNLFGGCMADGALFFHVDGPDYENVYPLWRWRHIPGITGYDARAITRESQKDRNKSSFVCGAAKGACAMTAMTCDREGVVAQKAWAFTPSCILAFGAGISSDEPDEVATTVEQCNRRHPVRRLDAGSGKWTDVEGLVTVSTGDADLRVLHGATGYIVRGRDVRCEIRSEHRKGDFGTFMGGIDDPAEGDVFELDILHGAAPKGASYEYWIVPGSTEESLAAFDPDAHIRIEANSGAVQRVRFVETGDVAEANRDEPPETGIRFTESRPVLPIPQGKSPDI